MGFFSDLVGAALPAVANAVIPGSGAIAGIAQGVIGGIGSAMSKQSAYDQQALEMQWQSAEAQKNRDFQREERELTQQYNSPLEQRKRLEEAGINVNSMIEGGYNPIPSSSMSGSQASLPGSLASSMLLMNSQNRLINAQADLAETQSEREEIGLSLDELSKGERLKAYKLANKEQEKRIRGVQLDNEMKDLEKRLLKINLEWRAKFTEKEYEKLKEEVIAIRNAAKVSKEQAELVDAQTYNETAKLGLIQEQTWNEIRKGELYEEQIKERRAIRLREEDRNKIAKLLGVPLDTPEWAYHQYLIELGEWGTYFGNLGSNALQKISDGAAEILGIAANGRKPKVRPIGPKTAKPVSHSNPAPAPKRRVTTYYE